MEDMWQRIKRSGNPVAVVAVMLALSACGTGADKVDGAEAAGAAGNNLVLAVESAETGPDGRRCMLGVTARNNTDKAALNVQVAWMAQTDGFGFISDYQVLGDFAPGELRSLQLGIFGAPCNAVQDLKLTRAVCTVGPAESQPESCADLVMLDGRGVARLISR